MVVKFLKARTRFSTHRFFFAYARSQPKYNILYGDLRKHVSNCGVDLFQHLAHYRLNVNPNRTAPTWMLTMQGKNASAINRLVNIEEGDLIGLPGQF